MDTLFLILSLFVPRITLLIYYFLLPGAYPSNSVPILGDIILGVVLPRILILIYIYENMGYNNIWFFIHLIVALLVFFGGGREGRKRFRR